MNLVDKITKLTGKTYIIIIFLIIIIIGFPGQIREFSIRIHFLCIQIRRF